MESSKSIKPENYYKHKDYNDIVKVIAIESDIIYIEPIVKDRLFYLRETGDYFSRWFFEAYYIFYPQAGSKLWKALNENT